MREYLGSYLVRLNGEVDALVFTGGIGENSARIREQICEGLQRSACPPSSQLYWTALRLRCACVALALRLRCACVALALGQCVAVLLPAPNETAK